MSKSLGKTVNQIFSCAWNFRAVPNSLIVVNIYCGNQSLNVSSFSDSLLLYHENKSLWTSLYMSDKREMKYLQIKAIALKLAKSFIILRIFLWKSETTTYIILSFKKNLRVHGPEINTHYVYSTWDVSIT